MKAILFFTLVFVAGGSYAEGSQVVPLKVTKVWCDSGAEVNEKETVSVGFKTDIGGDLGRALRPGDVLQLRSQIDSEGSNYESGAPPCPTGDFIKLEFEIDRN